MTIATTDGRGVWAFRYSSEGGSRSLYFSTRMDALKALCPESEELAGLSDEARGVVSEPLATFRVPGTRFQSHPPHAARGSGDGDRDEYVVRIAGEGRKFGLYLLVSK